VSTRSYDVVAAEVHRKALENLTNEMAIALVRTSGSPVVTEAKDFSTCVLDTIPEHLGFAAYVLFHAGTSLVATEVISQLHADGVQPGDGWIVNDPHEGGAAHQGDVAIVMPVFHEGELLAWTFANMHVLDVGGTGVSAFAPGAYDMFEEGLRFPPLRIIRGGEIQHPWEDFIAANVRMPGPVLNDIRSMIASNNVGARKFREIVDEYGRDRHVEFCRINKDLTEELLRQRIALIPDGIYETVDWNEFDGHAGPDQLLEMRLRLEVDGTDLRFSYSGVPQVDAFVNSTRGAMLGQTLTAVLTTLTYADVPINGGLWRPISVDLGEPGTIVNSRPPAAVSNAHSEVGMRAVKMTREVLSQALALSSDARLRSRVGAQAQDGWPGVGLYGLNQHRSPTVVFMNDCSIGQGGGAQAVIDGQDAYGCTCMTGCGLPDVEGQEALNPLLFLWRRIVPNSGGPGQWRGGQGMEEAFVIRGTERLAGPGFNACAQVPPRGFGGGYPAAASSFYPIREANVAGLLARGVLPTPERLEGAREDVRSKVTRLAVHDGEVMVFAGGGGGGVGDPLLRSLAAVHADVRAGYVTASHAQVVYGVVLAEDGDVDPEATALRRREIRRQRIGSEPTRDMVAPDSTGVSVGRGDGSWVCTCCAGAIAPLAENWRDRAAARETLIDDAYAQREMYVRSRSEVPEVTVREYFCTRCAAVLGVDVATAGLERLRSPEVLGADGGPAARPAMTRKAVTDG
jgi:N-methylhydantoinase B